MALRSIRVIGDGVLNKRAREVEALTPKITELIEDMFETMYEAEGVGLAAPQIGVLKRVIVIDCGERPLVLINPEILQREGEQVGEEGCLSVPGKCGIVRRPQKVKFRAYDHEFSLYELEVEDLEARAVCHEIDHLNGELYVDKVEGDLVDVRREEEE